MAAKETILLLTHCSFAKSSLYQIVVTNICLLKLTRKPNYWKDRNGSRQRQKSQGPELSWTNTELRFYEPQFRRISLNISLSDSVLETKALQVGYENFRKN